MSKRPKNQPTGFCAAQLDEENLRFVRELALNLGCLVAEHRVSRKRFCLSCAEEVGLPGLKHGDLCAAGMAEDFISRHESVRTMQYLEVASPTTESGKRLSAEMARAAEKLNRKRTSATDARAVQP